MKQLFLLLMSHMSVLLAIGGMYLLGPLFPLLLTAHFPSEMVNNEVHLK